MSDFWGSAKNYVKEIPSANKELAKEAKNWLLNKGIKIADKLEADKIEKAVKAAQCLKTPDEIQNALKAAGTVLGGINTFSSVAKACKDFDNLIAAARSHENARSDDQKAAALVNVSVSMLKSIESFSGVSGIAQGNIVKAIVSVGTKAIGLVAGYANDFTWRDKSISELGWTDPNIQAQGYGGLAMKLYHAKKTEREISDTITALIKLSSVKIK
ncbi:MAG: hypothetical protein LBG94_01995 [Treponema sp.]|jgi:hypothetical protein|nr:hypothetical protein [Treponema sp.]